MDIKSKTLEMRSIGLSSPRIPVTTRITIYLYGIPIHLHLPLLLGGSTTQGIRVNNYSQVLKS